MSLSFSFPEAEPLDLDEEKVTVFSPPAVKPSAPEEEIIQQGLDSPIREKRIEEVARRAKNALILVDDYTRITPVRRVLPRVLERLASSGLPKSRIRILVALGMHRRMTDAEVRDRFGEEIARDYEIIMHDPSDEEIMDIGYTDSGIRICVNPLILEAGLILGVGRIAPHGVAGYSGGSKIILPGVAGVETIGAIHWASTLRSMDEILGVRDSAIRQEMDAIAFRVGSLYIVNVVQNPDGGVVGLFAGDFEEAHRRGAELAERVYGVRIPRTFPIVIADAYPAEADLWQAAKAVYASELVVDYDGVIILVARCRFGVSETYPVMKKVGYVLTEEARGLFEQGIIPDKVLAAHIARVGRVLHQRAKIILVSPGVERSEAEGMGLIYSENVGDALEEAYRLTEAEARVALLRNAGEILPIIERH